MNTNARIYVLRGEDGLVKVGHSVNVERRAKQIGGVAGIAHVTEVKEQVELIERTAHRLLRLAGKKVRGEWFSATLKEAVAAIELAERIANGIELPLVTHPRVPSGRAMTPVTIWLPDELLEAVDAVIEDREGQTDRGSVIREYLAKGFKAG